MIIDVFLFNDEFDMLKCRMYELDGLVDVFVAIEGDQTMSGARKPYRLWDSGFRDRRLVIVKAELDGRTAGEGSTHSDAGRYRPYWQRDWVQRAAATQALSIFDANDVVMFGDVDEIPKRSVVASCLADPEPIVTSQRLLIYSLSWTGGGAWKGTVIGMKRDLPEFQIARKNRESYTPVQNGGWHLTWFGGREAVRRKVLQFAHGEMAEDVPKLMRQYDERKWPGDGRDLDPYGGPWPRWVEDGLSPKEWSDDSLIR